MNGIIFFTVQPYINSARFNKGYKNGTKLEMLLETRIKMCNFESSIIVLPSNYSYTLSKQTILILTRERSVRHHFFLSRD